MKKGFTLSETLISIAIIGVISAVLIPVLNNVRPDKERILYKKALYTMQNAIATAVNDNTIAAANSSAYWADPSVSAQDFCANIASSVNTVGSVNCAGAGSFSEPNFTTVNGSKWWGLGGDKFSLSGAGANKDITVDVNGSGGANAVGADQLRMRVRYDGRVTTDPSWTTENEYLGDAMKVNKD